MIKKRPAPQLTHTAKMTPASFVKTLTELLRVNNYKVEGPLKIHGAEVDLKAVNISDPFASPMYIEATIEYVDVTKYGKDLTKLALVKAKEPACTAMIVTADGFSLPVKERADETGVKVLTYRDLFSKFERFDAYSSAVLQDKRLVDLNMVYEEPIFKDLLGQQRATEYLNTWLKAVGSSWLIIVGDYGTGKTALSNILQYRWMQSYLTNPSLPIPFRIELRDFSHQFNAEGLLHHFLDKNRLGTVPVDFVLTLIKSGRIILILDGYDEMAQHLHLRERRACLQALAELSSGGAKGIITSRPNYFSEAEELQIVEILYNTLKQGDLQLSKSDEEIIEKEKVIDDFFRKQFLDRCERVLRDLTQEQTEHLVRRILKDDTLGTETVLNILKRVFRHNDEGKQVALSGKPVIVKYLIEVVEQLKKDPSKKSASLTEWQVYSLIIENLMKRDFERTGMMPAKRRSFLRVLAVYLSKRDTPIITEDDFKDLIAQEFKSELAKQVEKSLELDRLFSDLRSSTTLTKDESSDTWKFSHNSLREFLVTEKILDDLRRGLSGEMLSLSDAMVIFASSQGDDEISSVAELLRRMWSDKSKRRQAGICLSLIWKGVVRIHKQNLTSFILQLTDKTGDFDRAVLCWVTFPEDMQLPAAQFHGVELTNVSFKSCKLRGASFRESTMEGVIFVDSDLEDSDFRGSLIIECDFSCAKLKGANFKNIDKELSIIVETSGRGSAHLYSNEAIGYLHFQGAQTDAVPDYFIYMHHPRFEIIDKIIKKFYEQSRRQRHGLEQRGAAQKDPGFAKRFIRHLESKRLVRFLKKDQVEATDTGKVLIGKFLERKEMAKEISDFLKDN